MNIHKKYEIQIDLNYFHISNSFVILTNLTPLVVRILCKFVTFSTDPCLLYWNTNK